jgi:hypothetical protein
MRLRRRWVLAGLAALVMTLPLLAWGGFALPALVQGEHFYCGLPSRLWADAVRRWHRNNPRQPRPVSTWFGRWMLRLSSRAEPPVLRGDPAAVPVLSDLVQCRDENVRWRAARALARMGPTAKAAVPALLEAVYEESPPARAETAEALVAIGPAREEVMPTVRRLLARGRVGDWLAVLGMHPLWRDDPETASLLLRAARHDDLDVRNYAVCCLGEARLPNPVHTEQVIPLLLEALRDEHQGIRRNAAAVLRRIDPEAAARAAVR